MPYHMRACGHACEKCEAMERTDPPRQGVPLIAVAIVGFVSSFEISQSV